jgi:hypothetical protein
MAESLWNAEERTRDGVIVDGSSVEGGVVEVEGADKVGKSAVGDKGSSLALVWTLMDSDLVKVSDEDASATEEVAKYEREVSMLEESVEAVVDDCAGKVVKNSEADALKRGISDDVDGVSEVLVKEAAEDTDWLLIETLIDGEFRDDIGSGDT